MLWLWTPVSKETVACSCQCSDKLLSKCNILVTKDARYISDRYSKIYIVGYRQMKKLKLIIQSKTAFVQTL